MIKCLELGNKEFASKEEMFLALKENATAIIALKKSQVYKACEKGQAVNIFGKSTNDAFKASFMTSEKNIYPIISTTNYRDSHKDVHFNGCFKQTCTDQQGRVMYALDHKLEWDSVISWPKDTGMFISGLDWGMVGKNYAGQTEGLVFDISKQAIKRRDVLQAIEEKASDFENSIRMVYHKIVLGANSNEKSMASEKAYYDSKIALIANKEDVEEDGYFWGVEDLGIYREGSLVVAGGSNDATRIILGGDALTPKTDPLLSSQPINTIFNNLII